MLGPKLCYLQCPVTVFDDPRNLSLTKNKFANTAEENIIVPLLIKQMEKRKKEEGSGSQISLGAAK